MLKDLKIKEDFVKFMRAYGVVGVAIGIVMGNAIAKVINGIVEGLIMPVIEVLLPGSRWQEAVLHLGRVNIKVGLVIAAIINLFAVAIVVFLMFKYLLKVEDSN
jgi:large conductance mechanosensitive channel